MVLELAETAESVFESAPDSRRTTRQTKRAGEGRQNKRTAKSAKGRGRQVKRTAKSANKTKGRRAPKRSRARNARAARKRR